MKRIIIFVAATLLSVGCMTVPVAASETVVDPASVEVEARLNYSPYCPTCGALGRYEFEQPDGFGHTMVFRTCLNCNKLYHYYA